MSYWEALLNLIFPPGKLSAHTAAGACLLCRQPFLQANEVVCDLCLQQVRAGRPPFCRVCGREQGKSGICSDCRRRPETFFQRAVSYGAYAGKMSELILTMKRDSRRELLPVLAGYLFEAYSAFLFEREIHCLVPVPMARERQRERGFNQAHELAALVAERARVPLCQALTWQGEIRKQRARSRDERLQGFPPVFVLTAEAEQVAGHVVCLVDDVYTTGATANACAQKLLEAGARAVYVLTVAR